MLEELSKKHKVHLIGGSVPEFGEDGKIFNASYTFNDQGKVIGKHRKVHLFDIDIPGKIVSKESSHFGSGKQCTVVKLPWCHVGIGICYDLRFAELGLLMAKKGASLLVYPAVFSAVTGPHHFELLLRGRALDTQTYVASCGSTPWVEEPKVFQSHGHSSVTDPFGRVIATSAKDPTIVYADINPAYVDEVRAQIPVTSQKRLDIYELQEK
jgi:omega-amidase